MNTKIIEMEAIAALKKSLLQTKLLMPAILEGSTEPTWDGHVHVYENKSQTKESHKGKIPIQVKGTYRKTMIVNYHTLSFEIAIDDLTMIG